VDPFVAAGRAWVSSVVLLELYAGAGTVDDIRDVNDIRAAARDVGRLYHPTEDDLVLAGRVLSHQTRRQGALRPRDHSHDLLIAIGAARTGSALLTANGRDMQRWAGALERRARLRLRVVVLR
jgi:predicted nucleic acid-binding protein